MEKNRTKGGWVSDWLDGCMYIRMYIQTYVHACICVHACTYVSACMHSRMLLLDKCVAYIKSYSTSYHFNFFAEVGEEEFNRYGRSGRTL